MIFKKLPLLITGACLLSATMQAQQLKQNYIQWWPSSDYYLPTAITKWKTDKKVTDDDNFFISRVKPKARFRNAQTQVDKTLEKKNDKRLLAWFPYNEPGKDALPNGVFDSEVFSMWSYVDHWGNFAAPLGRVPAALLDVAHKNGVAVSGIWSIPFGQISNDWLARLNQLKALNSTDLTNYLLYYGNDGLAYNSEFESTGNSTLISGLINLHKDVEYKMREKNPVFENIWYDGTNEYGSITFDRGLMSHNDDLLGKNGDKPFSLFFNYNWNDANKMSTSVARADGQQRDPLYIYAGFNMQGGEPRGGERWPLLARYRYSIGLWGAHSRNMFWESRNEQGSSSDTQQRTYMLRTERWYSGSTRNPANAPELDNSLNYSLSNPRIGGMAKMMSARSSLSWDLSQEAFVTYFNLGNGKFFNWNGERQHDKEWYNVGVQDYLPTWRWWFASSLLGINVPSNALDAEFTWNDAYMGGSCMRVFGTYAGKEYLHLFKTEYALKTGDVITVRYKHAAGTGNVNLVLTAKNAETTPVQVGDNMSLLSAQNVADDGVWMVKTFTVGNELANKELALIALELENANNLSVQLGEISIVRGKAETPKTPSITSSSLLSFNRTGVDAKLIWNMENTKAVGEPCYNSDVKTSVFKLWAEQENGAKTLMGITTSWAGMMYSIPMDFTKSDAKVRLGVSAVSMDMKSESEIAWTSFESVPNYVYSNDVQVDKNVIKPNEKFTMSFVDPKHATATWKLKNETGTVVFTGDGTSVDVTGLEAEGNYDLEVTGLMYDDNGSSEKTITYPYFLAITSESLGALPEIKTLTANNQDADVAVNVNEDVELEYTGRRADGTISRGLNLKEKGFIFKAQDAQMYSNNTEWTMSFWLKFNSVAAGNTQFLDLRDQNYSWPQNNWGCFWSTYDAAAKELQFTIRNSNGGGEEHQQWWDIEFKPGTWTHFTVAMEKLNNGTTVRAKIYINGKLAKAKRWKYYSTGEGLITSGTPTRAWWDNAYMMLGFGRHQCAAIDGIIDDVKFFKKTLTEDEIVAVMKAKDSTVGGPVAGWSFEQNADNTNWFASDATGTSAVKAARAEIISGQGEGQGTYRALDPIFISGSPFAPGQAYEVKTVPSWRAPKGSLKDETGNGEAGSAKVSYASAGDYKVTLTLTNSYGSASKVFQVIKVGNPTAIGSVNAADLRTYSVDKDLFVEFTEAGKYGVQVYTQDGRLVANTVKDVNAGAKVHVQVATAGVYVMKVVKDGKLVRAAKLLCK